MNLGSCTRPGGIRAIPVALTHSFAGFEVTDLTDCASDSLVKDIEVGNEPEVQVAMGNMFDLGALGQSANDDVAILSCQRRSRNEARGHHHRQCGGHGMIEAG